MASNLIRSFAIRSPTARPSCSLVEDLVSSSQTLCQVSKFESICSMYDFDGGKTFTTAKARGATKNSMKLTCEKGLLTFSRSLRAWIGTPSLFSSSPCKKNSSKTFQAQMRQTLKGFMELEISAKCKYTLTRRWRVSGFRKQVATCEFGKVSGRSAYSSSTPEKLSELTSNITSTSLIMMKCWVLSVCRMASTQTLRKSLNCFPDTAEKMLVFGDARSSNNFAECMFSSGDLSL
mmetsp:Transcript_109499/g.308936  ORF Transcript_109499/g.308936 Transcript_109499/m.308936 type:complete len:234 (+) Transcript_109499:104-805(+)